MITAVVVEGRPAGEVAKDYGVARSWVYELVARYRAEGDAAFEPRSRRPKTSPRALPDTTVELIVESRRDLIAQGLDGGPVTIAWILEHHHGLRVAPPRSTATCAAPDWSPRNPRSGPARPTFASKPTSPTRPGRPTSPTTRSTGADSEILSWLDDHARYALSLTAHVRVTGPIVVDTFLAAVDRHGPPASTLTDNGMVFTTRLAGGRGGRNAFEATLVRLGIVQKNSRPNHPTTCGKVERFQQTLKAWLRAQPQPATIAELQALLDVFAELYNQQRPHRSLPHRAPPGIVYHARPKASPTAHHRRPPPPRPPRPRRQSGRSPSATTAASTTSASDEPSPEPPSSILVADLDIRIVHAATGELLRHLTLDPTRDYQPTGKPPGPPPKPQQPEPQ